MKDIKDKENYEFHQIDICDSFLLKSLFEHYNIDGVIHLAAESHVDNSIKDPFIFVKTNVLGTVTLLQVAQEFWSQKEEKYERSS